MNYGGAPVGSWGGPKRSWAFHTIRGCTVLVLIVELQRGSGWPPGFLALN